MNRAFSFATNEKGRVPDGTLRAVAPVILSAKKKHAEPASIPAGRCLSLETEARNRRERDRGWSYS